MSPKTPPILQVTNLPVIEVTWDDAILDQSHSTEYKQPDVDTFGGLALCQDVGYLVRWDTDKIVLAVSRCVADNDVRHSNTIPRSLIRDVKLLHGELPCPISSLIPKNRRKNPRT